MFPSLKRNLNKFLIGLALKSANDNRWMVGLNVIPDVRKNRAGQSWQVFTSGGPAINFMIRSVVNE